MAAAQFQPPSAFDDLYKQFKFIVSMDSRLVAGISKISGLTPGTQTVVQRGEDFSDTVRRLPNLFDYGPLVLERGITCDVGFQTWAKVLGTRSDVVDRSPAPQDGPRNITITLCNGAGKPVIAYHVHRCRVTECTATIDPDSDSNAVLIRSMTLQHEGWERDTSAIELTGSGL